MGRPLGSPNKLRFKDYMSKKELDSMVNLAKKRAETDSSILKFVLEQVFGKSIQPLANGDNEPFKLKIIRAVEGEDYAESQDNQVSTGECSVEQGDEANTSL